MKIKLDKQDIERSVEKYYKKGKRKASVGLIYDKDTNCYHPYIKVDKNYLEEKDLKEIFSHTYNCNVEKITFNHEKEITKYKSIDSNLYGLTLEVKPIKKRKK